MKLLKLVFLSTVFGAAALPAHAQKASGAPSAEPQSEAVSNEGDIVVTARRQSESLMQVPVVVSVQNAETLARYNADSLATIGALTPSIIVASYPDQGGGSIAIRGISSPANQIGFEQAVSVAVDGVQASSGRVATFGFFDLEQVEVLKGPQALFYGKNSTAGVISITTKGPTRNFEASLQSGYEFVGDEITTRASVSGPLTDTLGARFAIQYRHMKGWLRNTAQPMANPFYNPATGVPASIANLPGASDSRPGEKEILGRVTLVYQPTDATKATLKLFRAHSKDGGTGVSTQNIGPCTGPFPRVNGIADTAGDCRIDNRTTVGDSPRAIGETYQLVKTDGSPLGRLDVSLASLGIETKLGEMSLSSLTGYTVTDYDAFSGFDQTTFSQLAAAETPHERYISQEFRLQGDIGSRLNFMVGGFFENSRMTYGNESKLSDTTFYNAAANRYVSWIGIARQNGNTYSAFGQLRYALTDQLDLAGGARWTRQTKNYRKQNIYSFGSFFTANTVYPGSDEVGVLKGHFSDSNVSPEVTLTWRPTDDLTLFGAYRTGFKSGGFGLGSPLSPATRIANVDYDSETAKGFEVGARGRFLDGKGFFSAALFHYNFSNLQVNVYDPALVTYVINNAGKVRQTGFELESNIKVNDAVRVHGALAYVDNKFKNFTGQCYSYAFPTGTTRATAVPPPNCRFVNTTALTLEQVFDGRTPARSPKFTANAGVVLSVPLGGQVAELTGDSFYSSAYYASDTLVGQSRQKNFWRFNASASIASENDSWKLALVGRNLTNKYVLVYAVDRTGGAGVPGMIGEQRGVVERGREITLQATFNFK
ncbi:TonB-dependent receptor [Rhizorhabdus wittichii]|uniref:TonB-dependent receptor n=1 Tax=Rhizorhabdus wittichii TaxID=160791 RepID=A0A975CZS1_9SPHN|nr:TonB-dependent receptor [Rhizorhabdus wittichii]QTH20283.1 TonB-dependent receptor [Rhizorhabdus wittichii]